MRRILYILAGLFNLFVLAACSSQNVPPTVSPLTDITTSSGNYPAAAILQEVEKPEDGLLGLVKIFAEHGFEDVEGTRGTYTAQGTGIVVIREGRWFIVTAKHMIVPNPELKSIILDLEDPDKEITFGKISNTRSRVIAGYTSVEPSAIWLPIENRIDVAVLEISEKMASSLVYRSLNADRFASNLFTPGHDVEVWGYPAKQSPQVQRLTVSDVATDYFVLNQALEQGYSGGLVLLSEVGTEKTIAGMVIRADKESNQSIVLTWSLVNSMLDAAANNTSSQKVAANESVQYKDVLLQFAPFHTSPFTQTTSTKWWEVWK
jgi:hypothetical protein